MEVEVVVVCVGGRDVRKVFCFALLHNIVLQVGVVDEWHGI